MLRSRAGIACLLPAVFFSATTLGWLTLDHAPPNWDDAWYLTKSLAVYDALTQHGIAGFFSEMNSVFGFKAPLIAALPIPFYLLFGRHWHAAFLVNVVSMMLLFAALGSLARRWRSSRAAVFAIAVAGTMPLLYGLSRWYMVEYSMTALLAASVWVLVESDDLRRDRYTALFGLLCGLGLLLKVSFPLFALPPFVYVWLRSGRRLRALALAGIPCVVAAFPWYVGHAGPTLLNALDAGFGKSAAVQGTGPILSVRTILTYFSHVAENGVSWYFVGLALLFLVYTAWRRRNGRLLSSFAGNDPGMLLAWLLPFVIFTFGGNKDIRYIAPVLPAVALALGFLLDFALPETAAGTAIGGAALVFPVIQMLAISFGFPYAARGGGYTRVHERAGWSADGMLKLIAADSRIRPGERPLVLIGTDQAWLNANNVELTADALQLPFNVETTAHEKDPVVLRQRLALASYFVYKAGGSAELPEFNPYAGELIGSVVADRRFVELPFSRPGPDGGIVHVVKNLSPGQHDIDGVFVKNAPRAGEDFAVDFGGVLALTNMSIAISPGEATIKFRWRCEDPPVRDYWAFTHLIDAQGRMVAQRDHRLLGGEPPLSSWRTGDTGEEEVHLSLPVGNLQTGLRVRFGLYDPPSGERLAIGRLQGVAAGRFSVGDQGTALMAPE